jgi:hypothetical protein
MRTKIFYLTCFAVLATLAYFGIQADFSSFVGSLFAAFLSVFVVIFVEMELRPQIRILAEATPPVLADGRKFLRVMVENRRLWWPLNLIMDRRPVYLARAWITFLTETNDLVFGRRMVGRWSNTPEPIRPLSVNLTTAGTATIALLRDVTIIRDAADIGSGSSEPLDVVMRAPNEDGCRGWNNGIIENPTAAPEDRFELRRGRYRALVRIDASGRSTYALFRIVCDVGIGDFRLEPLDELPPRL